MVDGVIISRYSTGRYGLDVAAVAVPRLQNRKSCPAVQPSLGTARPGAQEEQEQESFRGDRQRELEVTGYE